MRTQKKVTAPLWGILRQGLDMILPPRSLLTDQVLGRSGMEGELFAKLSFLESPWCQTCGIPFEYDAGDGALCGSCIARAPAFDSVRSAFVYDDLSRKLVLDFKHGGRTDGLDIFAAHMARAAREALETVDYIIPVPLHITRLMKRKFNQSALLAARISKMSDVPVNTRALQRIRATETQGNKSMAGRKRNVGGAFKVMAKHAGDIADKNILLVDDVYTTGATLNACTRALKAGGATHVQAVTLARVVRTADQTT